MKRYNSIKLLYFTSNTNANINIRMFEIVSVIKSLHKLNLFSRQVEARERQKWHDSSPLSIKAWPNRNSPVEMISKGEQDEMKMKKRERMNGRREKDQKLGDRFYHESLQRTHGTMNWRASESFTCSSRWKLGQKKSWDISYNLRIFILRV